ncbi:GntR family transcriptional regulator [Psychrobacillus sp. NPDC096426]|uniref:GntR family transcriptional regulator n=1 Tax=Psychrobacillus sp. NPDC096426 TaxID=3364491 RepID=UPI003813809A
MKKDEAYDYMKSYIINQTWKPSYTININEVSAILNMSRSPVMEALKELEQEEYVTIIPQVGAYVKQPSSTDLVERLLMRASLEALMAEWAAINISKQQLEQLNQLLEQMEKSDIQLERYGELNREFHQIIYEGSGLNYVRKIVEQCWDYMDYLEAQKLIFQKRDMSRSIMEHKMIYHCLVEGNKSLAKELMENHIVRAANLSTTNKYLSEVESNNVRV